MDISSIETDIAAIAALGTAAYGLVDTTKVAWGGISRVGYRGILSALKPFEPALRNAMGTHWADTIFAHWINGVPLDDQKTKAKSLIRLGLTEGNADHLASATSGAPKAGSPPSIDPAAFKTAVGKLTRGEDLAQTDINMLGRFDATVDAALDAAYERADHQYQNAARGLAAAIAIALALIANYAVLGGAGSFIEALLVGVIAVPLAPVAKDLSSALASAVSAMNTVAAKKT